MTMGISETKTENRDALLAELREETERRRKTFPNGFPFCDAEVAFDEHGDVIPDYPVDLSSSESVKNRSASLTPA